MNISFSKYEGAGNDFIILDGRNAGTPGSKSIAHMCDRHYGIGADGLMILTEEDGYDFRMRYFNSDGGEAAMCGNGARCISLFAFHSGIGNSNLIFAGSDGIHTATVIPEGENAGKVTIGMVPVNGFIEKPKGYFMDTGVPHYIEFVDNIDDFDLDGYGPTIRYSKEYAQFGGTNVNIVQIVDQGKILVRTYERGVEAETLACGTGVTASAIASMLKQNDGITSYEITVKGGTLNVTFQPAADGIFENVRLTGPARRVFSGVYTE